MTESDWNSCSDPAAMLRRLQGNGKVSERKLRLFGCTCVRRIWHLLTDERSRRAVKVAECVAEGEAGVADLSQAEEEAEAAYESTRPAAEEARRRNGELADRGITGHTAGEAIAISSAALAVAGTCRGEAAEAAGQAAFGVTIAVMAATAPLGSEEAEWNARWPALDAANAVALRDVFGPLPFRSVAIDRCCLTPTVVALAQRAYEGRTLPAGQLDPALLAALADALAGCGCLEGEVLGHLRQQEGVHWRGCWVVDLLLQKG